MNGVYRSVPDRRRLVPRERDPVTGRRTRTRDEKNERHARRPRSRLVVAGALAAVAVVAVAAVTFAVVLPGSDDDAATPAESGRDLAPTTDVTGVTPSSVPDPPATAITLEYSGGSLTRSECIDLLNGPCDDAFDGERFYDPLTVRCTPEGCTVTLYETHELGPTVDAGGTTARTAGCGTASWTLSLQAVGTAVTHGIEHPARLLGTATQGGDPLVLSEVNCLGGDEEYTYDATPL